MIEWFSATASAVVSGLVIYQVQQGKKWRDDINRKIDNLASAQAMNREKLKDDIADLKLDRAEQYVKKADCTNVRKECIDHIKEIVRDPICRKIDDIKQQRVSAWAEHDKTKNEVWDAINHHTHIGLPVDSKVIR
jgi:t-SNARE complex subunit (syntaxin)